MESQFQLLHDEHKEIDINLDKWNQYIVYAICITSSKIAEKKKTQSNKITDSTRKLMSPTIFTIYLENIFRTIDWSKKGINFNGEKLNHLRFAEDIIIITLQELDSASRKCALEMNMRKTETMAGIARATKVVYANRI